MQSPEPYVSPWMRDADVADTADLARVFFAKEVTPHRERFAEQHQVDRATWTKAGEAGLLLASIPEEYGGGGGTFAHEAAVLWEQCRSGDDALGLGIHSAIVAHYIHSFGTEEQKQRWLPPMASGDLVAALAMTEPGTGSDLQAVRTTARRDGDHYVVNGTKTFITNGGHADLVLLVARTGGEGATGISLLVTEVTGAEGFARGRVLKKIGQHGQDTRELSFTDMRVPVANLLGNEEGQGFYQMMQQLAQERLVIGIGAVAYAETAVEETVRYVKERTAFGKQVLDYQNTQFVLAECSTDVLVARTFLDHCMELHLAGRLDAVTVSRLKYWSTDMQCTVIDRCLQLFGGYGYITEYPIAQLYAGARVQKIYGGTNEIMKVLIARSL
ncbi:acyl-CoA dehydrogenase family protein [Nocardioides limicola]|uniref:acyl-CoA dehydrogenase family protein n=1 Tax=Nocardioides limicola TaxID=2803368 RepID=UPI001EF05729|nr:acyl-CoA dehydrogenase family protein [Nocardioides sp. DJM-14]